MQTDNLQLLRLVATPPTADATRAPIILRTQRIGLAWMRAEVRRDEMFSSTFAFLLSFAICFVGLGYGAYCYATWLLGA